MWSRVADTVLRAMPSSSPISGSCTPRPRSRVHGPRHRRDDGPALREPQPVLDTATGVPTIDPLAPEAIVYEPRTNGGYGMVGVEYVVLQPRGTPQRRSAGAVRKDIHPDRGGQPLRPAAVLRAPRLDLVLQPKRNLQGLEPERFTPRPGRPGLDPNSRDQRRRHSTSRVAVTSHHMRPGSAGGVAPLARALTQARDDPGNRAAKTSG
jgi:hypothetical protein